MLEEAVAQGRAGDAATAREDVWSPQINIGSSVLIPEGYVTDLSVRLGLYRRIATLEERREIDAFAAELVDRFGPLPPEVENLLEIVAIKRLCRIAGVEKIDAGPKGTVVTLDRKSVVEGTSGSVRVDLGGRRNIKKKITVREHNN